MRRAQVAIGEIEAKLEGLWEALPGKEKVKAALFTLIAYVEDPSTLEHTQTLLKHILGRFPCRILLLKEHGGEGEVEAVLSLESVGAMVACDQIEITFPSSRKEEIPFIVLRHLLPNVPVCMLWKGKASPADPVYTLLKGAIDRLVIDPANLDQAEHSATLWAQPNVELIDLKWASITGWRRILAKLLEEVEAHELKDLQSLEIRIADGTPPDRAQPLSALYLEGWLASALGWQCRGGDTITTVEGSPYRYGTLLGVELTIGSGRHYKLVLEPSGEFVRTEASTPQCCEVPCSEYLGPFKREEIFAKELFRERPTSHYPKMLDQLPWKERLSVV